MTNTKSMFEPGCEPDDQQNAENSPITDAAFVRAAQKKYNDEGTLEVDPGAEVSRGGEGGAYVQCWCWVTLEEAADAETEKDRESVKVRKEQEARKAVPPEEST